MQYENKFNIFWYIDFLLCFDITKYNTLINLVPLNSNKKTATQNFLLQFERLMEYKKELMIDDDECLIYNMDTECKNVSIPVLQERFLDIQWGSTKIFGLFQLVLNQSLLLIIFLYIFFRTPVDHLFPKIILIYNFCWRVST